LSDIIQTETPDSMFTNKQDYLYPNYTVYCSHRQALEEQEFYLLANLICYNRASSHILLSAEDLEAETS